MNKKKEPLVEIKKEPVLMVNADLQLNRLQLNELKELCAKKRIIASFKILSESPF